MSKIVELQTLLTAIKDMELARLAQLDAQQKKLTNEIQKIRASRIPSQGMSDGSVQSGYAIQERWGLWVDRELRKHNEELLKLAVLTEEKKKHAQVALGRVSAFEKLIEQEKSR